MSTQGGAPIIPTIFGVPSVGVNYPAGSNAWNGTPTRVAPVNYYLTPGTAAAPTAQQLNFQFNRMSQDTSSLSGWQGPAAATWLTIGSPWATIGGATGLALQTPPAWIPVYGYWLVNLTKSSDNWHATSPDGVNWTATDLTTTIFFYGVITRANDGAFISFSFNSSDSVPLLVTGSTAAAGTLIAYTPGAGYFFNGTGGFLGTTAGTGLWVAWIQNDSTHAPIWTAAAGTGAWTAAATWSPPPSFVIHPLAHIVTPTQILIFPSGTSVTSEYMLTTDGKNWSTQAMVALNAGESVVDACYDSVQGLYYLLTSTASVSRIWQSPSGSALSWDVVQTWATEAFALRANGAELLAWVASKTLDGTIYRGVTATGTVGFTATTWSLTPLWDATAPTGKLFGIHANGSQWLYTNNGSTFSVSRNMGNLPTYAP